MVRNLSVIMVRNWRVKEIEKEERKRDGNRDGMVWGKERGGSNYFD